MTVGCSIQSPVKIKWLRVPFSTSFPRVKNPCIARKKVTWSTRTKFTWISRFEIYELPTCKNHVYSTCRNLRVLHVSGCCTKHVLFTRVKHENASSHFHGFSTFEVHVSYTERVTWKTRSSHGKCLIGCNGVVNLTACRSNLNRYWLFCLFV